MFEAEVENDDKVDACMQAASAFERGDTLPWHVIEAALGHARCEGNGWHIIGRFRRRLELERRIVCRAVPGVGLLLLKGRDSIVRPMEDRSRKALRQTGRAIREISQADANELSMHDLQLRQSFIDRSKASRRLLRRSVKEVAAVTKTETLPRRTNCHQ